MEFLIDTLIGGTLPHKHKTYEIIAYIKGYSVIHAGGEDFSVGPGKVIIIPPGVVHHSTELDFEQIYIRGDFTQFSFHAPIVVSDNTTGEGLQLTKMIYDNRYADPEYVNILIQALAHFLLRNIHVEDRIFAETQKIAETISTHFADSGIQLNALLKKSGYAEDYIRAQFKKIMGKTPTEFLTGIRIRHACQGSCTVCILL